MMLERARELLAAGDTVVLDASWASDTHRRLAREVAEVTSASLVEILCDADDRTVRARIGTRAEQGNDPSDATVEVSLKIAERFDPWPEANRVDTGDEPEKIVAATTALFVNP